MRRTLTMVLAAMLASLGTMFVASPASAHHTTITAKVTCADDGAWTVSWAVENWNGGGTATVTASTRNVVPVGTTIANNSTKTFTERVTTAQALNLTVDASWPSGNTARNAGSVPKSAFPSNCAPADKPVTPTAPSVVDPTCDIDGRLVVPADTDKVGYAQTPVGHGPGTYTITATAKPGFTIDGQSTWTLTVKPKQTGPACLKPVTPVAPDVQPISGCGEYGHIGMIGTEGITYEIVEGDGKQGPWKVIATIQDGYTLTDGATTEWSGDLGTYTPCPVPVTPVAPEASPIDECGEYGEIRLPQTEGITYEIVEGDGKQGPWKVIATIQDGYTLTDGATTEWSGDLGTHTPCPVPVTPVAPVVVDLVQCETPGSLTLPITEGVLYDVVRGISGQGPWSVVATVLDGFVLADGARTSWSGDFGELRECGVAGEEETKEDGPADRDESTDTTPHKTHGGVAPRDGVLPNTGSPQALYGAGLLGLLLLLGGTLLVRRRSTMS